MRMLLAGGRVSRLRTTALRRLMSSTSSSVIIKPSAVWQETKNKQGRVYYVNQATGVRSWEHPGSEATVLKIQSQKFPEFKTMSDRVTYLLTNSAGAYYGLFFVVCAGLTWRVMYPPKPEAPTIAPAEKGK